MKKNNILLIICSFFIAIVFFIGQYHFDNKYTYDSPIGYNGVIDLSTDTKSVNMLTYGWKIYQDVLIDPQDIENHIPSEIIYIGQYNTFDFYQNNDNHNQATYHLKVKLPSQKHNYAMEIPEIYSASRIYINNDLMWVSGNLENYKSLVHTGHIMFQAENEIDITIQVKDESHYYSGVVYPFLFGYQQDIMNILNMRQMLRYIVCTIAFVISLLTFALGIRNQNNRISFFILSLFSLCACLYLAYPLYHL